MPVNRLRMTVFDSFKYSPKCLQVLDVKKLEIVSETAMTRMLMASGKTLKTFKMSYRNGNTFSRGTMCALAKYCLRLENVEFASLFENIQSVPSGNLGNLKQFLYRK